MEKCLICDDGGIWYGCHGTEIPCSCTLGREYDQFAKWEPCRVCSHYEKNPQQPRKGYRRSNGENVNQDWIPCYQCQAEKAYSLYARHLLKKSMSSPRPGMLFKIDEKELYYYRELKSANQQLSLISASVFYQQFLNVLEQ